MDKKLEDTLLILKETNRSFAIGFKDNLNRIIVPICDDNMSITPLIFKYLNIKDYSICIKQKDDFYLVSFYFNNLFKTNKFKIESGKIIEIQENVNQDNLFSFYLEDTSDIPEEFKKDLKEYADKYCIIQGDLTWG